MKRKFPLKKNLPTCFLAPSASGQSYLTFGLTGPQDVNIGEPQSRGYVWSDPIFFLRLVLFLIYSHSDSHDYLIPSFQRRLFVLAVIDKAQGYKGSLGPNIAMRHSNIRDKDVHFRYSTSSCASHVLTPPSSERERETHFFHPASSSLSAYIFPIAPIPINPIVGC